MPNLSFDIFFDQDFINISASRGKHAPKAKPEWKVRTAPKLPPKEKPVDPTATPRPEIRPPINSTRNPVKLGPPKAAAAQKAKTAESGQASESNSQAGDKPKRKPPKLGPRKNAPKAATDIPAPNGVKPSDQDGALQPTIQSATSTAGSYAGGALNSVGSGINGVGESISGTIRRYGDGVRDYGNGVMDWANAPGTRAQTAANPLGLNSGSVAGKGSVTRPSVYSAPQKPKPKALTAKPATTTTKPATTATRTVQPQKKLAGAPTPVKKAVPVSTQKRATSVSTPASTTQPKKTTVSANSKPTAVASKTPGSVVSRSASLPATKQVVRPSTVTNPVGGMKPSTAAVGKAKPSGAGTPGKVGAGNPLGLSF